MANATVDPSASSTVRSGSGLEWRTLEVDARHARFAVGGRGLPVLFLHGWSLGPRAYEDVLHELMGRGCRVYAPALPGFGGTANLPAGRRTIEGYAEWVEAFLDELAVDAPIMVVGHSLGGGVAIGLTDQAPARVAQLVLINSVGTPAGSSGPELSPRRADRAVWENGLNIGRELFWSRDGYRILQSMRSDLVHNLLGNPLVLVEMGRLARAVDLTAELTRLRDRDVPILVLWSDGDGVLPRPSFDALCAAIGTEGRVLRGGHSWLLANPRALSEVLDNLVQVQAAAHETTGVRTTAAELRTLLRGTNIPRRVVTRLLTAASPLWMMSERPSVLAGDLVLCHPALARAEVRAVARPLDDPATFRVTVVAADRPGLLADSAGALAEEGLTVLSASVATWADSDIALHSLTCRSASEAAPDWSALGERLRSLAAEAPAARPHVPTAAATVTSSSSGPGRHLVTVTAPDGLGLLAAIGRWFTEQGVSIEAAEITTVGTTATDRFLVVGDFEPSALACHLSPPAPRPWPLRLSIPRCRLARPAIGWMRAPGWR